MIFSSPGLHRSRVYTLLNCNKTTPTTSQPPASTNLILFYNGDVSKITSVTSPSQHFVFIVSIVSFLI